MEAAQEAIGENRHGWLLYTASIFGLILAAVMWLGRDMLQDKREKVQESALPLACPSGWLNYEGKCYFFSEEERSWTSGQSFCASYGSSLAAIESEAEKAFLLRYMGTTGHWIGLRKDPRQTFTWADGTEFNTLLELKGETGDCAFLSTGFAMASDCHIARKWICSQPDAYTRKRQVRAPVPAPHCDPPCPHRWIGYKGKCYFFSREKRNWNSSQNFCSSFNASLTRVEMDEKDFVMRLKCKDISWIGLWRDSENSWLWADGEMSILEVFGEGGNCAYLDNQGKAISSGCHTKLPWICSKSAAYATPNTV